MSTKIITREDKKDIISSLLKSSEREHFKKSIRKTVLQELVLLAKDKRNYSAELAEIEKKIEELTIEIDVLNKMIKDA